VLSALAVTVVGAPAQAHVVPWPVAVPQGEAVDVALSGRNERERPMVEFSVTAPAGVTLEHAHPHDGWTERITGSTATWSGGSLPYDRDLDVLLTVRAAVAPGRLELRAEQRYADGGTVRWPVSLTVVPGEGDTSGNMAVRDIVIGGGVALVGLLLVAALALLSRRRRGAGEPVDGRGPLQEK
jgi:hypothetical protein